MDNIIKVDVCGNVSLHEYPVDNELESFTKMIGKDCELIERVTPKGLYKDFGGVIDPEKEMVSMLIDESGMYHMVPLNLKASLLYGFKEHKCPIVGDVLFVAESMTDFKGISQTTCEKLVKFLKSLT